MGTLPRGFGFKPDTEEPKRCKLGLECGEYGHGCKFHKWCNRHEEFFFAFLVLSAIIICGIGMFGILELHQYIIVEPIKNTINGFNCNQLLEYVADKGDYYQYAEHRYEWLCVNEKIKEFQG